MDPKTYLHLYLQQVRDVLVWKLDGLSEYDARRPLTPTGTNLLGLVKHLTGNEFGYFGEVFDRPAHAGEWLVDRTQSEDFLARPEEAREDIIAQYKRSWEHADATIAALDLDSPGKVPHFPEGMRDVTLLWMLVHMITETCRHAGHADIVRELIDGRAGYHPTVSNLPDRWSEFHDRVEIAAREAARITGDRAQDM
ncbi:DinB family protein [Streptomyces sp. MN03-5084-2B]|nr:DinB family protein [Streptomyces sp. MN03-5084-2B]